MKPSKKARSVVDKGSGIHRAGWIISDCRTIIENGYIETQNGVISGIHTGSPSGRYIDHGPGILIPPLVNAHLHLELSALKGLPSVNQSFLSWVRNLIVKRQKIGTQTLLNAARESAKILADTGNLFLGDISTIGIAQKMLSGFDLYGISFAEFLGSAAEDTVFPIKKNDCLSFSLAGHAPHTTSPDLLKYLKQKTLENGLPFSIHLAESKDEAQFLQEHKGAWADFLTSREIDWSSWRLGRKTPVAHAFDLGLLDASTLAVHLLETGPGDLELIAGSRTKVCLCPRSNLYLHDRLPDIDRMLSWGIKPALGTDSLASCDSLDILDEMKFVKKHYPHLPYETIFEMGTINGAKALDLSHITGTLSKGKQAVFAYLPVVPDKKKNVFKRIFLDD